MVNNGLNTIRTNLWKPDRPLHSAVCSILKISILDVRKRSMDVGLEEFLK